MRAYRSLDFLLIDLTHTVWGLLPDNCLFFWAVAFLVELCA